MKNNLASIYFVILLFSVFTIVSCSNEPKEIPIYEKDFCASIHRNDSVTLSEQLKKVDTLMQTKTGIYVLEDGGNSMIARAWLSEYAEKTIDVQYFIFSTDNVGLIACDYLVRAANRGIKVRILVDDIMVDAEPHDILTMDSHENIEIKIYNPGTNIGKNILQKIGKLKTDFRGANQRMHNKTFIVDEKVVITGGRNIADEYFDYDHEYNFRDRDILLLGKTVKTVQTSFNDYWNSSYCINIADLVKDKSINNLDTSRFKRLHQYACNPENFWPQVREKITNIPFIFNELQEQGKIIWTDSVSFVADIPGKNDGTKGLSGGGVCTSALIDLVKNAKNSIEIQSPYLITTELGKKLFEDAIKRGVKIRILTNSLASTDNLEAFSGYKRDREKLLKTGVRIFEFKPDAKERFKIMTGELQTKINYAPIFGLHAKTMVIDNEIIVIGTFNLDPRSANLNTECLTIVKSKEITKGVLEGIETEFLPENSWETTLLWNPDKEAGIKKVVKAASRRVVPKSIL
ncbi:MAG: phospholipase D family protein [Bacteroidota bacterium]